MLEEIRKYRNAKFAERWDGRWFQDPEPAPTLTREQGKLADQMRLTTADRRLVADVMDALDQ